MDLYCTGCNTQIKPENINETTGLAVCGTCHAVMKISDIADRAEAKAISPDLPEGSRLQLKKGHRNNIELLMPRKGFTRSSLPGVLFSGFWLGFVALWTTFTYFGDRSMALYSIPFWIAGLLMLKGVIIGARSIQKISIDSHYLTVERWGVVGRKKKVFPISEVESIEMAALKRTPFSYFQTGSQPVRVSTGNASYSRHTPLYLPTLYSADDAMQFFEQADKKSQEWAVAFLDKFVKTVKEKEASF